MNLWPRTTTPPPVPVSPLDVPALTTPAAVDQRRRDVLETARALLDSPTWCPTSNAAAVCQETAARLCFSRWLAQAGRMTEAML